MKPQMKEAMILDLDLFCSNVSLYMLPDLKVVSQSGNKFILCLFKAFEFNLMGVPYVKSDAFGIWDIIRFNWDDVLVLLGIRRKILF